MIKNNKYDEIAIKHFFDTYTTITDDNSCWLWNGLVDKQTGYGRTSYLEQLPKQTTAHRTAYTLVYGEYLKTIGGKKTCIRHLCHNKLCINPKHLALGTYSDNAKDSSIAGVGVKMTKEKLIIALILREQGHTFLSIGKLIGVSAQVAAGSLNGRSYYCRELLKEINNERIISQTLN